MRVQESQRDEAARSKEGAITWGRRCMREHWRATTGEIERTVGDGHEMALVRRNVLLIET